VRFAINARGYLLNDSQAQAGIAEKLLHGTESCTASITVFLDLVWVLVSCDCERAEIGKAIQLLCRFENFKPQ